MSSGTYFLKGSWNVLCDRCGFRFKADEIQKEWTGELVCSKCYETRHPQDFLRSVPDNQTVPYMRPYGQDVFVSPTYASGLSTINSAPINGFLING